MIPYIIVALAYIITAGHVDEPLRFTSKARYKDLETCQEALKSKKFQEHREALSDRLVKAATEKLSSTLEDGETVDAPAVAITASCEEDPSL